MLEVEEREAHLPRERLRDALLGGEAEVDQHAAQLAPGAFLLLEAEPQLLLR